MPTNDADDRSAATPFDRARASRFAGLGRAHAALVLAALLSLSAWFVGAVATTPTPAGAATPGDANGAATAGGANGAATANVPAGGYRDSALYGAIIARVHAGQGYYDAAGLELRARNYPTRPVFNWREPTYAWLLGRLPWPSAWLVALGLCTIVLTFRWIRHDWGERPAFAVVMLHAGALPFGPEPVVFQEVWAGSLIILSATLYAGGRWRLGLATALAALAFREQALLPCGVALCLALRERRWPEVRLWIVGLVVWTGLMALHFRAVARHLGPADFAIPSRSWLTFGGPRLVVAMLGFDAYVALLPALLAALVVPLALFGYASWRNGGANRMGLVLLGFVIAFSIVGKPFDTYWGSLFVPLLSVGLVRVPLAARDLYAALREPSRP